MCGGSNPPRPRSVSSTISDAVASACAGSSADSDDSIRSFWYQRSFCSRLRKSSSSQEKSSYSKKVNNWRNEVNRRHTTMGDDSGAIARSPVIGRILSPVCRGGDVGGGGGGGGNRGGSARSQASSYFSPTGGLEDGLLSSEERLTLQEEESLPLSSFYKVEVIEIFKLSLPVAVATLCELIGVCFGACCRVLGRV